MPIPKMLVFNTQNIIALSVLISLSLILIAGTPGSDGSLFTPYNYVLTVLGGVGIGSSIIQMLHDAQKLNKFSFVFSLLLAGVISVGIIYLSYAAADYFDNLGL